jgi:hypothetical protein
MADERRMLGAALFARPQQLELSGPREPVSVPCQECGSRNAERYDVLRVTGWKRVTRCQACLAILDSEDAPTPFGFTYLPYGSYLRSTRPRSGS